MKTDTLSEDAFVNLGAENKNKVKPTLTKAGVAILGISGACFVGIYSVTVPFLLPALRRICLPFVPATANQVSNVFNALKDRTGKLIDIGSGDGRIVIEAAKRGFQATGVELNTWLVLYSRLTAYRQGVAAKTAFLKKDLWLTDMSLYKNVVIFGVEQMMEPLEKKLERELKQDAVVVACRFPFPSWQPCAVVGTGVDTVWLYRRTDVYV